MAVPEQILSELLSQDPQMRALTLGNVFLSDGSWTSVLAAAAWECLQFSRAELYKPLAAPGHGVLPLESSCPPARRFNPDDADARYCWFGPSSNGTRFVWFERIFTKQDIWKLPDIPSERTNHERFGSIQTREPLRGQ
jgi:hypothetical protein